MAFAVSTKGSSAKQSPVLITVGRRAWTFKTIDRRPADLEVLSPFPKAYINGASSDGRKHITAPFYGLLTGLSKKKHLGSAA
jgi:hypothetical protein